MEEISREKLLDLAERETRMYVDGVGSYSSLEKVRIRKDDRLGVVSLEARFSDLTDDIVLGEGSDLEDLERDYLDNVELEYGDVKSFRELEMYLESRGY